MVVLMFEDDTRPIIQTTTDQHPYIYINEEKIILNDKQIFSQPTAINSIPLQTYGYISTCTDILDHNDTNIDIIPSLLSTTPIIKKLQSRGIYEMKLQQKLQNDGGANRSVTNCKQILYNYKDIPPYPIGGANNSSPAIYCSGYGYIKWYSPSRYLVLIPCYYSEQASGTIISPTDIVFSHIDVFNGWQVTTNVDDSTGIFTLLARHGVSHTQFPTFIRNNLWFHHLHVHDNPTNDKSVSNFAVIRNLTYHANYELWHHRLGHPGRSITEKFHYTVIGVPPLRPTKFHACGFCLHSKFHSKSLRRST